MPFESLTSSVYSFTHIRNNEAAYIISDFDGITKGIGPGTKDKS